MACLMFPGNGLGDKQAQRLGRGDCFMNVGRKRLLGYFRLPELVFSAFACLFVVEIELLYHIISQV